MDHRTKRPVFLNLFLIRLPVGGVVSILHRVSGVVLALSLPLAMWSWGRLLAGPEAFAPLRGFWSAGWGRALLWLLAVALAFHFLAGLRHLLLDLDLGVERGAARRGAWAVLLLTPLLLAGLWLWA